MNSKDFLSKVFKTGEAEPKEVVKFMLKEYFLKGYTLEDFEEDLVLRYNHNEKYAEALKESFEYIIKEWSK